MTNFSTGLAAALAAICLFSPNLAGAQAMPTTKERLITITASGMVTARPDQASVSIGVVSNARTAKAALAANTASMRPVIDALKAAGIEDKDIATSNFNLQPAYEYTNDGRAPKLTGYQATNTVNATVRAIGKLGEILDLAAGEGSNQISGVSFVVSKADQLKDAARKDAVANATRMAKVYAEAAGVALGEVLTISDSAPVREVPMVQTQLRRAAAAGAPAPIEPGEQTLEAQVTMVWAIK